MVPWSMGYTAAIFKCCTADKSCSFAVCMTEFVVNNILENVCFICISVYLKVNLHNFKGNLA